MLYLNIKQNRQTAMMKLPKRLLMMKLPKRLLVMKEKVSMEMMVLKSRGAMFVTG